jgi:hypothetical protein
LTPRPALRWRTIAPWRSAAVSTFLEVHFESRDNVVGTGTGYLSGTCWVRSWEGTRAGLDAVEKRKILVYRESNPAFEPVTHRYTNWTTSTHRLNNTRRKCNMLPSTNVSCNWIWWLCITPPIVEFLDFVHRPAFWRADNVSETGSVSILRWKYRETPTLLSPFDKNNINHRTFSSFWTLSNVSYSEEDKLFRKLDLFLSSDKRFQEDQQFKLALSNVSSFSFCSFKRWWCEIQFPKCCVPLECQKMDKAEEFVRLSIPN